MTNPLNYLYELVAWVLREIYSGLSPLFGPSSGWTWALSIVILVVIMRLIMVPLFMKQMKTTRAMSALAPEMAALRKKYKDDKQTLNQETMKLYQQAGVNPLMGCLPVALQLPLFFSLFSVLRAITSWVPGQLPKYGLTLNMVESARKAKILGATVGDKVLFTDGVHVPLEAKAVILVAVAISMTTTYLTIRQSMKRGMMPAASPDNPMASSQKLMQYIMPLFALTGLYWQFGLVLYWVTTNVWTLGQQWLLSRNQPLPAAAGAGAAGGTASAPALNGRSGTAKRDGQPAGRTGTKPSGSKPSAGAKPAGSATKASAGSSSAARRASNGASASAGGSSRVAGGQRTGGQAAKQSPKRDSRDEVPATVGASSASSGGLLRKLSKGRSDSEPDIEPEEPEVKIVRQQRQRQSRSRRSGRR